MTVATAVPVQVLGVLIIVDRVSDAFGATAVAGRSENQIASLSDARLHSLLKISSSAVAIFGPRTSPRIISPSGPINIVLGPESQVWLDATPKRWYLMGTSERSPR